MANPILEKGKSYTFKARNNRCRDFEVLLVVTKPTGLILADVFCQDWGLCRLAISATTTMFRRCRAHVWIDGLTGTILDKAA